MADLSQTDWETAVEEDSNAFILDVRTPEEVEEGYIAGATNIDFYEGQDFINALEALDKTKHYYVYCRSGNRSGQACAYMEKAGFTKAYNLVGGILKWEGDLVEE